MNIHFQRILWAGLGVCAGLAAAARADDMVTISGQTYTNIVVQQYSRHGLVILHDAGRAEVPFADIQPELRAHYKARAIIPIPLGKMAGEKEEPAGPNDLATLSGQIYRNVVLKRVDADRIFIGHDTGMDTVFFSALSPAQQEKYRTGTPVVPDPAPDGDDIVTTYGHIFRNTEILQVEPDGLTFRHTGGVTKLYFPALGEELQKKHSYDPITAWNYQRQMAAKKVTVVAAEPEPVSTVPANVAVYGIETEKLPDNKFWVRFSLRNLTDQPLTVQAVPCTDKRVPITDGKAIPVNPSAVAELQQVVVPELQPGILKITSGAYTTNCVLTFQ